MPNTRSVVKPVTQTVSKRVDSFVPRIAQRLTGDEGCLAYSLRDIGANGGPVVNLRRNHDNATRDFTAAEIAAGHVLSWGQEGLPSGTLLQVFVTRWYDQGNSTWKQDAVGTNAGLQPKLVLNSVYQTDGVTFPGFLQTEGNPLNQGLNWTQPNTIFTVTKVISASGFLGAYYGTSAGGYATFAMELTGVASYAFTNQAGFSGNTTINDGTQSTDKAQHTVINNPTTILRKNGTQVASKAMSTGSFTDFIQIGDVSSTNFSFPFSAPEMIFFNSVPSDKFITELENNQKNYYGI